MTIINLPRNYIIGRDRLSGVIKDNYANSYSWRALFREPVQDNIAEDSATLYFPLTESDPSTVLNTLGTKTLTLEGSGGHIVTSPNMYFNTRSNFAVFNGLAYLKGNVGEAFGIRDGYFEFDYYCWGSGGGGVSPIQIMGGGPAVLGNSSWAIYVYDDGAIVFFILTTAGAYKYVRWTSNDGLYSKTWHRVKIQIDRDNTANRKCWVDDVALTNVTDDLGDASAEDITGTYMEIGAAGFHANYIPLGGISNVKVVYGSYTGSTTPAFKVTPSVLTGSSPTYTRNSIKKVMNAKRNYISNVSYYTQLQGNPSVENYDLTTDNDEGILVEHSTTNHLVRSREFDNASWTKSVGITVTAQNTAGIDGVQLADKIEFAANTDYIQQDSSLAVANKYHTLCVFIKALSGQTVTSSDFLLDLIDIGTGTTRASGLYDAETGLEISSANSNEIDDGGWRRVYVAHAFSAGSGNVRVNLRCVNAAGKGAYFDVAELQKSEISNDKPSLGPTSPIVTSSATATRASDSLTVPNTDISSKFTVLSLIQFPYASGQCAASDVNYLLSVNSNIGESAYFFAGTTLLFYYFGTPVVSVGKTWNSYDWMLVGMQVDTDSDKYNYVWDGILGSEGTTAKGTPTYSTALCLGKIHDSSYYGHVKFGPTRIYNGKYLSQDEITSIEAQMRGELL
ncbi:MAG TPA: phage head spike fiber domain-containing protein [Candidatus Wunengus sp. YC60]|uniref:phage head spike fiber domain-containing protein n=1 Tax=Candidatus Wunengus sp. YC60 TaxID=3367697 RepID=UPI0040296104